ncbi:co-chaperone GrpE [Saprolegnia diclina VS20]|uniref:GrpE protein homolog n=1 Tax=Saprolegnia diclina (strain VS20) TaxID=1156394 RepID=T0RIG1_SAPDV|nr:co-chaperone GrpE [Saprolegnia diclina VS20]EQC32128.1 co-chaperone GrpE [Saprolegnia diclina VS20]|eukprot:XP_008614530.1 co-chaperone GrpE [Saprolegnia diclina VS20]
MLARHVLTKSRAIAAASAKRSFFRSSLVMTEKKEGEGETAAPAAEEAAPEDPVAALTAEVEALKAKNAELSDKVLRALADAENVRRISRQDVNNAREFSISKFAKSLLDVSDNLKRAHESITLEEMSPEHSLVAIKSLHEGVVMTDKELQKVFNSYGINSVGAVGDKFDPNFHEAMFEYPDEKQTPGTIGQLLKVGYSIHSRCLRPAQVGIIKAPPAQQ